MQPARNNKAILWFLVIAFGFSWPLFALPLAFGAPGTQAHQIAAIATWTVAMWGPGLGALIATRYAAGDKLSTLNLGRLGPKRFYVWALLLPPALALLTGLLTLALGFGQLDLSFALFEEALASAPNAPSIPPELLAALQILLALTLAPFINTVLALGEELGWRGFLLPRLIDRMGQWRAIILGGVIWGLWHAPAILQGHNYPGQPLLGIPMMAVFTVLLGAIFSWLYLETRSPWAPALAHGAVNASAALPLVFIPGVDIVLGGTVASVTGWIALAVVVAWLVISGRLPADGYTTRAEPAAAEA